MLINKKKDDKMRKLIKIGNYCEEGYKNIGEKIDLSILDGKINNVVVDGCYRWYDMLEKSKKIIDTHKKKPSEVDKDPKLRQIGKWISHQQQNYANKEHSMKNSEIYKLWEEFVNEYKEYLLDNEEKWKLNFDKTKKIIDQIKKRPSEKDADVESSRMATWINVQQTNYSKKINVMKNDEIYYLWTDFLNQYQKYFMNNDEQWKLNLNRAKKYIDENKKKPSCKDKNLEIKKLAKWILQQQTNHRNKDDIMKNDVIYKLWKEFIEQYEEYFLSNEEQWKLNLNNVKKYIDENNKRPSEKDKNIDFKKLGQWISHQQKNYSEKKYIMENNEIYNLWKDFIYQYKKYFKIGV